MARSASEATLEALLDRAAAHYGAGRLGDAAAAFREEDSKAPDDIRAAYSLAVIDLRQGQFGAARRRLKAVIRRKPDQFPAHHNLGVAEQSLGHWSAAAQAYRAALALKPDAWDTAQNLAIALAVVGHIDEAARVYRHLAAAPDPPPLALPRLAILSPRSLSEAELDSLEALTRVADAPEPARVAAWFGLGVALEARGDVDGAWEAFASGNAAQHRLLLSGDLAGRPDRVARENQESIDRVASLFTPAFLAANAGQGDRTTRPIFIVGMPRSGTSLVEQIIASHPQAQGMGESASLWNALAGAFPYPPEAPREADHFRALARRYLKALRDRGWRGTERPTDKTLDNHLHVGMIHLLFPKATIVHVVRDPIDTGIGCWRQLFARGNETLYDLAGIGAEQRRYAAMMAHWDAVLPGRVIRVSYEDLTAEPERAIRRLIVESCGLPWDARCLHFHSADGDVRTASAAEVRQPVHRSSVGRGRLYGERVAPLIRALGDLAQADPR